MGCVHVQAFEKDPIAVYFSRGPSYTFALIRAQFRLFIRGLPRATHFYATESLNGVMLAMQYPQQQVCHTRRERPPAYMCVYHLVCHSAEGEGSYEVYFHMRHPYLIVHAS